MRHIVLDAIQAIFIVTLFVWIVAFGFSVLFRRQDQYLQWSGRAFRTALPYIVAIAFGYFLAGKPFVDVTI